MQTDHADMTNVWNQPHPDKAKYAGLPPARAQFIEDHIRALDFSGYTIVPDQLTEQEVAELRIVANNSVADHRDALRAGLDPDDIAYEHYRGETKKPRKIQYPPNFADEFCRSTNSYLWGDAGYRLLDHDLIHEIASRAMPSYKFLDVMMNGTWRPAVTRTWGWHRDHGSRCYVDDTRHLYLWFFFLLDDFTAETGATWVVPGTHRMRAGEKTHWDEHFDGSVDHYPSKIQALAKAGDVVIVNPNLLHSAGENFTTRPRRTMNVRIGYRGPDSFPATLNHYENLCEERKQTLPARVLRMMQSDPDDLPSRSSYPVPVKRYYSGGTTCERVEELAHV